MKSIFLVDADDTILDFHGVSESALRHAFEKNGIGWLDGFDREFHIVNASFWAALERKEITRSELMAQRFPAFLRHLGIDGDGEAFNRSFVTYLAEHPRYLIGAEDFLRALKERGSVYIVTNGTAWIQRSRFAICGLTERTDGAFISDEIGYDKPSKSYTDYVIERIPKFEKSAAVWIGDSLSADIQGAKNADIDSIWYNPHGKTNDGRIEPTRTAKSYTEILRILEEI